MKIAVVGTGISGNAAAWALARQHDITVYERNLRVGGHSATVTVDHDGVPIPVDTGFIVYNELNYPDLTALFAHLEVATEPSNMSFSVSIDEGRREWCGDTLATVFAQKRNLFSPAFIAMLTEILRFNRTAPRDRAAGLLDGLSLGDYLRLRGFSGRFCSEYLVPMGAAIWSTPPGKMLEFPAESLVAFFDNHRLMHWSRPQWRTVSGGSRRYVERLTAPLRGRIRLGTPVVALTRHADHVMVRDASGHEERFDQVIVAAHSDEALAMLTDPSDAERAVLGAIGYRSATVYLHRDASLMPKRRRAWAAWNYLSWPNGAGGGDVAVTYWMNRLQNIDPARPLFVSLNPPRPPREGTVFGTYDYAHPQYDAAALAAQKRLGDLQGVRNTWYCGAWHGYGFHEDGLRAGLDVAEALGATIPWRGPRRAERVYLEAAE